MTGTEDPGGVIPIGELWKLTNQENEEEDSSTTTQEEEQEQLQPAKITSWQAYQYQDQTTCPNKLKLVIEGKYFTNDTQVFIGKREASKTDKKTSKKITATFCMDKLLKSEIEKRSVSVKNPDTGKDKAKHKLNLNTVITDLGAQDFDQQSKLGVENIQRILYKKGYITNLLYLTGNFGPITTEAVKKFQADKGIEQTGFVGPLTQKALKKAN